MAKPETTHSDYFHFCDIPTRWEDNDQYGHVNNIIYLSFFDTAVNTYLIGEHALNLLHGDIIGYVVETNCKYFSPLAFPEIVTAGLRVNRIGETSVTFGVSLFSEKNKETPAAEGIFTHVYVDRKTERPVKIPKNLRQALESLH
ncbi:MAG: acyl-CoA thioesterase [Sphingomonadales bacterium]